MLAQIYQLVEVVESKSGIVIHVAAAMPRLLGLQIYAREVEKLISRTLRRAAAAGASPSGNRSVIFAINNTAVAYSFADMLRRRIDEIATRAIARKHVERVLRITQGECTRWTKDGRLPKSGNLIINRGKHQRVQVSMYSPEAVADLASRPEVINFWRRQDALE